MSRGDLRSVCSPVRSCRRTRLTSSFRFSLSPRKPGRPGSRGTPARIRACTCGPVGTLSPNTCGSCSGFRGDGGVSCGRPCNASEKSSLDFPASAGTCRRAGSGSRGCSSAWSGILDDGGGFLRLSCGAVSQGPLVRTRKGCGGDLGAPVAWRECRDAVAWKCSQRGV